MPPIPQRYWWLSFVDATRPKGEQFLGATVIEARSFPEAIQRSWEMGVNPGGECAGSQIPSDSPSVARYSNRLVDKAELNAAGEFSDYDRSRGLGR